MTLQMHSAYRSYRFLDRCLTLTGHRGRAAKVGLIFFSVSADTSSFGAFRQREEERILQLKATMSVCSEGFLMVSCVFFKWIRGKVKFVTRSSRLRCPVDDVATRPCRFGKKCKKRDCPNAHPEGTVASDGRLQMGR